MLRYFGKRILYNLKSLWRYILKYKIFFTSSIVVLGILGTLSQLGWLNSIFNWLGSSFLLVIQFFGASPYGLPNIILIFVGVWLFWITYWILKNDMALSIVAGAFEEDFKHGLYKWDYFGDWKILQEDKQFVLSVSGHESEGITKKGFTWSDYEFSFETKIVKRASGWIVRAEDKNRFFMLQLFMEKYGDKEGPMLRPHYRETIDKRYTVWAPIDSDTVYLNSTELKETIKLFEWIKVRIVIRGEDMNVYINGVNVFKYNLYKTISSEISKTLTMENAEGKEIKNKIKESLILGGYRYGSVGFREASDEQALFRNVKIKPLQ